MSAMLTRWANRLIAWRQRSDRNVVAKLATKTSTAFSPPALSETERELIAQFNRFAYHITGEGGSRTYYSTWMGYEMFKWPTDLWSYQEIVTKIRPDVIVETGTYRGGSALFLASICDLLGHGHVVTVDMDVSLISVRPRHPRITYINGSSTSPEIFSQIERIVAGRKAVVILDSDHRLEHVAAELRIYQRLVPVGSYLIVEDTVVNGHPAYPEFGPGPWEAVQDFLEKSHDFVVDRSMERVFLTQNPSGYLRRVQIASK